MSRPSVNCIDMRPLRVWRSDTVIMLDVVVICNRPGGRAFILVEGM